MHTAAVHIGAAPAVAARSLTCRWLCRIGNAAVQSHSTIYGWDGEFAGSHHDDNLHMASRCAHNSLAGSQVYHHLHSSAQQYTFVSAQPARTPCRAASSIWALAQCASTAAAYHRPSCPAQSSTQHNSPRALALQHCGVLVPRAEGSSSRHRRQHGGGVRCAGAATDAGAGHIRLSERQDGAQGAQGQAETEVGRLRRAGGTAQHACTGHKLARACISRRPDGRVNLDVQPWVRA
jgi:hypothetical protein